MRISVIIPYRRRPAEGDTLLQWTLQGYAQQQLRPGDTLELLIGNDGGQDTPSLADAPGQPRWRNYPRIGAAAIRNRLASEAQGDLLLFGNADARPDPDMVRQHADALAATPTGSMVLGSAPWEKPANPTVFDALLADTPAVFFYHQLQAGHWYDFRHAWTLNLSIRRSDFLSSGGFFDELRPVYYEDLALGYRLLGPDKKGILYHPAARVLHRHPTTLDQYLDREELLGLMAPVLARISPGAFAAIFGATRLSELASRFTTWVAMDAPMHRFTYQRLKEWAAKPEQSLGKGESATALLMTIYQMHIPLKRLAFRLGFLRGLELADDAHWQERQPQGLWRKIVAPDAS